MNLAPIIRDAVNGATKEAQELGERTLMTLRKSNPGVFMLELSRLTKDEKLDELLRQSASTLLGLSAVIKVLVGTTKDSTSSPYLWDAVPPDSKTEIRNNLLSSLVSASEIAKRGASAAISRIAVVEVSRGEWQDLVRTLLNNTTNANEEFKRTSLLTIGFICEQFKQHSVKIPQPLESDILAALIQATRDPQIATKVSAYKAVQEGMGFMTNVLAQKPVRDHIVGLFVEALKARETTQIGLQGISEFIKFNFEHIEGYIKGLLEATFPFIGNNSAETIIALDLWDYIGYEYLERLNNTTRRLQNKEPGNNLLLMVHETLVPAVLSCLIVIDGDENSVR